MHQKRTLWGADIAFVFLIRQDGESSRKGATYQQNHRYHGISRMSTATNLKVGENHGYPGWRRELGDSVKKYREASRVTPLLPPLFLLLQLFWSIISWLAKEYQGLDVICVGSLNRQLIAFFLCFHPNRSLLWLFCCYFPRLAKGHPGLIVFCVESLPRQLVAYLHCFHPYCSVLQLFVMSSTDCWMNYPC